MAKRRADAALVASGWFESRAKAQEAIAAGLASVNGRTVRKASEEISDGAVLEAQAPYPWVSRGGVKLAAALDAFGFDPSNLVCLDIGSSTGGFTQVLLARHAKLVYAVDVGTGQLHPRLAADPRVVSMERQDVRTLSSRMFPQSPHLLVCDVSFISLKLALPAALALASPGARLVALIKPQFEAGPQNVTKGIVRDPRVHERVCGEVISFIDAIGWTVTGLVPSPIAGGEGNREFLVAAELRGVGEPRTAGAV